MISRLTRFNMALVALSLSACALFGDDSDPLENLREQVRATVHDQERAEAMVASVDQIDQLLMESAKLLVEVASQERLLFTNYDSTPRDFELLFSETGRKRQEVQEKMLDVHLEFKATATSEEWETIRPVHSSAVTTRIQSLVVAALNERQ